MQSTSLQTLHVLDARAPQDVQALLEARTDAVFAPVGDPAGLVRSATVRASTSRCRLTLTFVDALSQGNSYRIDVEAWVDGASADADVLLRPAQGWIELCTRGLETLPQPAAGVGSASRREALVANWCAAVATLADAAATQRRILQALHDGATFSTAHKEGGATIRFDGSRYEHAEYGDSPSVRHFAGEAELLAHLRKLFDYETSRHVWPAHAPEADAWRLILRRLQAPRDHAGSAASAKLTATHLSGPQLAAVAIILAAAAGLAYLKWHPKADAVREGGPPATLDRVQAFPVAGPEKRDWQGVLNEHQRAVEAAQAAARGASR